MKILLSCIVAAGFLVVFTGCKNTENETMQSADPVSEQHGGTHMHGRPYHQGLIEEYRSILVQDPKNYAAMVGLGNAYFESGAWHEAIGQYEQALAVDPHNSDLRTEMGTAYRNSGMPERALREYRLALKHQPGHLNARYQIGIVYAYDFRDYAAAVRVWEEVLQLAPNFPHRNYMKTCMVTFRKSLKKELP